MLYFGDINGCFSLIFIIFIFICGCHAKRTNNKHMKYSLNYPQKYGNFLNILLMLSLVNTTHNRKLSIKFFTEIYITNSNMNNHINKFSHILLLNLNTKHLLKL